MRLQTRSRETADAHVMVGSSHPMQGCDVTKRAIIDVNYVVSGRNYDIFTSIIAQLVTSRPFGDLSLMVCLDKAIRILPKWLDISQKYNTYTCAIISRTMHQPNEMLIGQCPR